MPRLAPSIIARARSIHPFLPLLLRPCREISFARNELRWLRDYALSLREKPSSSSHGCPPPTLLQLCRERALGKPLQYILGDQPFGPLDIKCRRGVLIPRPETEMYTMRLAELIIAHAKSFKMSAEAIEPPTFRILDLCTGSGCIALLLHALLALQFPRLSILGLDVSDCALRLAKQNLRDNVSEGRLNPRALKEVSFRKGDVLKFDRSLEVGGPGLGLGDFDLVVSNPPYISEIDLWRSTERSVRNWEPRMALVPPPGIGQDESATLFFGAISRIARAVSAKVLVAEIGRHEQIAALVQPFLTPEPVEPGTEEQILAGFEVWCDEMHDGKELPAAVRVLGVPGHFHRDLRYSAIGSGNERAVIAWRDGGEGWLGRGSSKLR